MIAAIYARKSTGQQVAEDAKSVTRQIENAKAFAAQQGWTVEDRYVFVDDGISGAETKRLAEKQRMLDLIRTGAPFDVLVMQSQDRFSRRDGDEAFAELKSVARRGVEIWFYADRQPFRFGSLATNVVGLLQGEFAAEFRRAIATKTYEAMARKAKAGHVTGGKVFGYENVRVDGHVERRIIDAEAAVIREVFRRSASGEGLRAIAKTLNAAGAPTPRSQQGRPRGWAPSSIREVLHRSVYRGVVTWNKTKKRDLDGHQRQHDRPQSEWITMPSEQLRIVDDDLWRAVHDRLRDVHASASAAPPLLAGRGIRQRYFLSGFARCVQCGGAMQAVSRSSSLGRSFRYVCATYWNRGSTVCANGLMAPMTGADRDVRDFLQGEVLRPRIIERALDIAITLHQRKASRGSQAEVIQGQLSQLEHELANLAETAARDGAIPAVLEALRRRDEDRRRLTAELAGLDQRSTPALGRPADLRARLRQLLKDWNGLLAEDSVEARRRVLDLTLTDRIRFTPDLERRRYELRMPISFHRVIIAVVPALREGLQEMMASPPGFEPGFQP